MSRAAKAMMAEQAVELRRAWAAMHTVSRAIKAALPKDDSELQVEIDAALETLTFSMIAVEDAFTTLEHYHEVIDFSAMAAKAWQA